MNILIVGLGSIARKHLQALNQLKIDAEIYALRSNIDADNQTGIKNIFSLENLNIVFDFAIVSNPTHLHHTYIEKLANLNIPLFIEKPAVDDLSNVDSLIQLIASKNLTTYVACNLRFHPCLVYFKNILHHKISRINEVNVYCGSYLPDWRTDIDFRSNYSANKRMGGGVHLDLFHELDYVKWFFGFPFKYSSVLKCNSSLEIDSFDYANYILEYESFTTSIILNYFRRKPKRLIEIVCENQTIKIDLIRNKISDDDGTILFNATDFNVLDTYKFQLEYFINCLNTNQVPMNTFAESIETLKICLHEE